MMILFPITHSYGYSLFFLNNTEFDNNLGGWCTVYEHPYPYYVPTHGTVEWSSSYGGSARIAVGSSGGLADLISFINTIICPGDTVICHVTTGTMVGFCCLQIGGIYTDFFQQAGTFQGNTDQDLIIIADKLYMPGTTIQINLSGYNSSAEVWVHYVRLNRCGVLGVLENSDGFVPFPVRSSLLNNPVPNPASKNVKISFQICEKAPVTLKVYDVNGRIIKTYDKKEYTPGEYNVIWDCTDNAGRTVANDVYFYELETGGKTYTRKSVIVR